MAAEVPHTENIEHSSLPNGLRSLIDYGNAAPSISPQEREQIFEKIASVQQFEQGLDDSVIVDMATKKMLREAEEDRHRLMWSYMTLIISRAYYALDTHGTTRLEDYIHSGIEGLYSSIDAFAKLEKDQRYAFTPFARVHVDQAINRQRLRDIYNTELGKTTLNALYAYRSARDAAKEQDAVVDVDTFTKEAGISQKTLQGALAALATYQYGTMLPETEEEIDTGEYEASIYSNVEISPRLQVSLLLLSPMQRNILVRYYGLTEEPTLKSDELSELYNISELTVRQHKDTGIVKLREILSHIDSYGLNFAEWPDQGNSYFRQNLSVLTYLFRANLDMTSDRMVQEHCSYAMKDLARRDIPDIQKRMVADMYGLHNGERLTIAKLMEKYGRSTGYFSQVAKKAMTADYIDNPKTKS